MKQCVKQCACCGKDVRPGIDCKEVFTGRMKYICFECDAAGDDQVKGRKTEYFYKTNEGARRLMNRRRKNRER